MKKLFVYILLCCYCCFSHAEEGLWLPNVDSLLYSRLQKAGLQVSLEDLYNENGNDLNDAVIRFGNGCSGVIVSDKGLILTNHHCAFRYVEQCSTLQNNYLENGYWADRETELPVKGLFIRLLIKMEDVTVKINEGIILTMGKKEIDSIRIAHSKQLKAEYTQIEKGYEATIEPLYMGNKYYLYQYQRFDDIRMVGIPPLSIGKFGKEADNWMWPRHTGDFAIFRIYASKENTPAPYSDNNVPYCPKKFVPMSIRPIQEGDFSMVMGYPGTTRQYTTSFELYSTIEEENPIDISMVRQYLAIIELHMSKSETFRLQRMALCASANNALKKMEELAYSIRGIHGIEKKKKEEREFQNSVQDNPEMNQKYGMLLEAIHKKVRERAAFILPYGHYRTGLSSIELLTKVQQFQRISRKENKKEAWSEYANQQVREDNEMATAFDKEWFVEVMTRYYQEVPIKFHFPLLTANACRIKEWAEELYDKSAFASPERLSRILKEGSTIWEQDPAVCLMKEINQLYEEKVWCCLPKISNELNELRRQYVSAHLELNPNEEWPDANGTMRLSYGKIKGYAINDTVYPCFTFMDGLMDKSKTQKKEYNIPEALKTLYEKKEFGGYDVDGIMPVCFIADSHTVGGSSGSPVFNTYGELAGLNFDRNRQGTMSDVLYEPSLCRNIVVDSRYILFIIQQLAKSSTLIEELVIKK